MTAKEREGTLSGILHDMLYRLPQLLSFKMAAEQSDEQPRLLVTRF